MSSETPTETPAEAAAKAAGKGRPTPKRSEAQRKKAVSTAPKNRKEAMAQLREKRRQETTNLRAAMKSGDVKALPASERTPEKILARAYVDTRKGVAWITFPVLVPLYVIGQVLRHNNGAALTVTSAMMALLVIVVVDSVRLTRGLGKELRARVPATTRSKQTKLYALQRSAFPRKFRQPGAIAKVGDPLPS